MNVCVLHIMTVLGIVFALPCASQSVVQRNDMYLNRSFSYSDTDTFISGITFIPNPDASSYRSDILAFRTNLLFDAATALNFGMEIPIGRHWSIGSECFFPWWKIPDKNITFQFLAGDAEIKYWFRKRNSNRRNMNGWYAGVFAGLGEYDIQFGGDGWQGEFFIASGLSVGYSHAISDRLSLQYGLGVGYIDTKYRAYTPDDGCKVYKYSGRREWFGPVKAEISLVWFLKCRCK